MPAKTLRELIDPKEPAWPLVLEWIRTGTNPVEVLPVDRSKGEATLTKLQVTSRSPMGAIALESGGLLLNSGWVRVLGAGHPSICGDIVSWNDGTLLEEPSKGLHICGYDVVGGLFAINGGALGPQPGIVHYYAPGAMRWESLDCSYSQFLLWLFTCNFDLFYEDVRWSSWKADMSQLNGDEGFFLYPPLWTKEGKDFEQSSKKPLSMRDLVTWSQSKP